MKLIKTCLFTAPLSGLLVTTRGVYCCY